MNLPTATADEIKQYMQTWQIGIDCSGMIVWILNEYSKEQFGKPIWHFIHLNTNNIIKKLLFRIRPVENISVKVLSESINTVTIAHINDIHVGDMIIGWYDEAVAKLQEEILTKKLGSSNLILSR